MRSQHFIYPVDLSLFNSICYTCWLYTITKHGLPGSAKSWTYSKMYTLWFVCRNGKKKWEDFVVLCVCDLGSDGVRTGNYNNWCKNWELQYLFVEFDNWQQAHETSFWHVLMCSLRTVELIYFHCDFEMDYTTHIDLYL